MNKKTLIALALVAFSFGTSFSATKKKVVKKIIPAAEIQKPFNRSDSLSYASGVFATGRLFDYLKAQYGLTEADIDNVLKGFNDARAKEGNKEFNAYNAGVAVYGIVNKQILAQTKNVFNDSPDSLSIDAFFKGFVAGVKKDTTVYTLNKAETYFNNFVQSNIQRKNDELKKENTNWLSENAKKEGVVTLPSGLQYKVITMGNGEIPKDTDRVTVKYVGKTIDGKEFDNSYKRNPQETTFAANQVIKGWTEALTKMPVGSKWQLFIPYNLAYGESSPTAAIKPFSTLIFDVELVKIEKPEAPMPMAKDKKAKKNKKK